MVCVTWFKKLKRVGLLALVLFVILPSNMFGQQVVNEASNTAWDYDTSVSHVTEFRIYVSDTPGIVPGVAPNELPTRTVAFPTLTDVITEPGRTAVYYAVCTAYSTANLESGPSNEIDFIVLGSPKNFRIADLMSAKVGIADQIGP